MAVAAAEKAFNSAISCSEAEALEDVQAQPTPPVSRNATTKVDVNGIDTSSAARKRALFPSRRRRVQELLAKLDTNRDGTVSKDELTDFIEDLIDKENRNKYIRYAIATAVIITGVLLGATAGVLQGIVKNNTDTGTMDGALTNAGSSLTLRTAAASFSKPLLSVLAPGSRRRLLADPSLTGLIPLGSVSSGTVAAYCTYLNEGHNSIPTSATVANNGKMLNRDGVSPLQITDERDCTDWAASLDGSLSGDPAAPASGIGGSFTYENLNYQVECGGGAMSCDVLLANDTSLAAAVATQSASDSSTIVGTVGRRLHQAQGGNLTQFIGDLVAAQTVLTCSSDCGCFPAAARVTVLEATSKPVHRRMDQLRIGDKVLARGEDGGLAFQDVYVFGHEDAAATASFVQIHTEGTKMPLELTGGHFLPTLSAVGVQLSKRARDVRPGDIVLLAAQGGFKPCTITQVSVVQRRGLFNPFTMSGDIVVNGVLASAHSDWLLDAVMPDAWAHRLPAIYQVLMAPARLMYKMLGAEAVRRADAVVGFAKLAGGNSGGTIGFLQAHAVLLHSAGTLWSA